MGIVGRGLQRVNNYLEAPPRGPRYHGDKNDPRYPSPREWRVFFAPIIDIALHAGLAATVLIKVSGLAGVALAIGDALLDARGLDSIRRSHTEFGIDPR
ncbi:hypothetical protein [Nocardia vinacea]|uniref:hypothetical protein n=1 Tax=Nocardia vinacea TaxID=96468 RepID=UPI0002E0C7D5|nr:hypothetical protein [Nocardia vinacea]